MKKTLGMGDSPAMMALGGLVAAGLVAVLLFLAGVIPDRWAVTDAPPTPVQTVAQPVETPPAEQAPQLPPAPEISLFRLDPDGSAVVAGKGTLGWQVIITLEGEDLHQATLDGKGQFAEFVTISAHDQPRILSLKMTQGADGPVIRAPQEVIIAPSMTVTSAPLETPETPSIAALDLPEGTLPETLPDTDNGSPQTEASAELETAQPEAAQPAPQTVLMADAEGVSVLQGGDPAPEVQSRVALDAITYDDTGDVALSGRAAGDGFVRVYLDNQPITTSRITEAGRWRSALPQVDTGLYTLRVDEVNADGTVTSRVETPFRREDDEVLAAREALAADPTARARIVTVQPGASLWAISRETYGEGILYVRVFEANRDRIRNPDLIYPGQVFSLPE